MKTRIVTTIGESDEKRPKWISAHASFWQDRKWQWILDALVFAALGFTVAWPLIAAGEAVIQLCQRLTV